jgi:hypothetical protein
MNAYHGGLPRNAAAWALRKQKGHRKVSEHAMIALEAVVQNLQ